MGCTQAPVAGPPPFFPPLSLISLSLYLKELGSILARIIIFQTQESMSMIDPLTYDHTQILLYLKKLVGMLKLIFDRTYSLQRMTTGLEWFLTASRMYSMSFGRLVSSISSPYRSTECQYIASTHHPNHTLAIVSRIHQLAIHTRLVCKFLVQLVTPISYS